MKTMTRELYRDLWLFIDQEEGLSRQDMEAAANTMADLAERGMTKDIAFAHSLSIFRNSKKKADKCKELIARLEEIEPKDI